MRTLHDTSLLPLLFAINHHAVPIHHHHQSQITHFLDIAFETGVRRIHSPQRILRSVGGGGLTLIPNSTTHPVRTSASSVVIGFDVRAGNSDRWSARLMSSCREECDVFLMDSKTLQRKAMAKIKVEKSNTGGHLVATSITLFDLSAVALMMYSKLLTALSGMAASSSHSFRPDISFHILYRRMVVYGEGVVHKERMVLRKRAGDDVSESSWYKTFIH